MSLKLFCVPLKFLGDKGEIGAGTAKIGDTVMFIVLFRCCIILFRCCEDTDNEFSFLSLISSLSLKDQQEDCCVRTPEAHVLASEKKVSAPAALFFSSSVTNH